MPKIRTEQLDFRFQHSTTIQLTNVLDNITDKSNMKYRTAATLIEIEKVFDKAWHDGPIFKLLTTNVPHQLIKILRSFLRNQSFQIRVGDKVSMSRSIDTGVSQGSSLSQHLFQYSSTTYQSTHKLKQLYLWMVHSSMHQVSK